MYRETMSDKMPPPVPPGPPPADAPPKRPLALDVADTLQTIEDFGRLLVRETSALRTADFKAVDVLQPSKRTLARRYETQVKCLSARRDEARTLDEALRLQFIKARTGFTVILGENLQALDNAKNSTRRLVSRILEAARRSVVNGKQTNYSSRGQTQAYKSSTLSLKIDQKL